MTDFDYDCLQKKRLAGQAKYRKCGSKSKKCTLPSDNLTQKQWKERCGPVVSFNFSKPMLWGDFKKLPVTVQTEYITNLQKKYGATAVDLANMFGVQALTVRKHTDANNLGISFPRGHSMNAARREEWNEFLCEITKNAVDGAPEEPGKDALVEEDLKVTNGNEVLAAQAEPDSIITSVEPKAMNMKKFNLQFVGAIDVDMIANSLKLILGNHSNGELEIICNLA